jgi:hypothetical protein
MAPFFVDLPTGRPDTGMRVLDEVVNLDAQLARSGPRPAEMPVGAPSRRETVGGGGGAGGAPPPRCVFFKNKNPP